MIMSIPEDCVGVVLAGGRSRRMGCDKALLPWQGRTLLDHAIARFRHAGFATVAVSGDRPEHSGILDAYPEAGPLGGLLAVARAYQERYLVVVPVDMPKLTADWLIELAAHCEAAAATHFLGFPMPLSVKASPEVIAELEWRLTDPGRPRAVRAWLCDLHAAALPLPTHPIDTFDNANTPENWKTMRA